MPLSRRTYLSIVTATGAVAGCLGTDGGDGGDGDDGNPSDGDGDDGDGSSGADGSDGDMGGDGDDDMADGGGDGATVQVASHDDHGDILVDEAGMVLYMFDPDEKGSGESTCYDGCAEAWPPLTVDDGPTAGEGVTAELTTFEREDGETQVAADGWPLYYFANDEEPGDASGQGVNDVWWVLAPDGSPIRDGDDGAGDGAGEPPTVQVASHDDHGDILVDEAGMVLYMFDSDEQGSGESTCYDGCAEAWPPLTVDDGPTAGEGVTAELTTFEREDGETQVAADGWPLYYFANDEEPGDASGQGVNDVWWVLEPDGSPIRPEEEEDDSGGMWGY